jgi:hypothetical protein
MQGDAIIDKTGFVNVAEKNTLAGLPSSSWEGIRDVHKIKKFLTTGVFYGSI